MVDCAENAVFGEWDVLADMLYKVLDVLAFAYVVHGAGVVYNRQIKAFYSAFYVTFLDVNEGANE